MSRYLGSIVAAAIAICAAAPASADVTYSLVGFSDVIGAPQSFTLTLPDYLVRNNVNIPAAAFTTCVSATACADSTFWTDDPFNGFPDRSLFSLSDADSGTFYYFDKAAFTNNGVYENSDVGFNLATLTVSGIPGAVPEPAAWALMIGGFGAVGAGARRRTMRVAFA